MAQKGYESYCPLNKVRKKWSDRYKIIEEPLFKSYLFVHINEEQLTQVRFIDGVVNFVYWLGKPARLKEEDINKIKRFLNEYTDVKVEKWEDYSPGSEVQISSGVFMDHKAQILEERTKTVTLAIKNLGFKLVAIVPKEQVIIMKKETPKK